MKSHIKQEIPSATGRESAVTRRQVLTGMKRISVLTAGALLLPKAAHASSQACGFVSIGGNLTTDNACNTRDGGSLISDASCGMLDTGGSGATADSDGSCGELIEEGGVVFSRDQDCGIGDSYGTHQDQACGKLKSINPHRGYFSDLDCELTDFDGEVFKDDRFEPPQPDPPIVV